MPFIFWLAIIAAFLGAAALVGRRVAKRDNHSQWMDGVRWGLIAVLCFVFAGLMTGASSVTTVTTKNIGVVVSYGKPVGTLDNGIHPKAPWNKVHEMDGTVQTDPHVGPVSENNPPTKSCVQVRIAHQATACIYNSVRWWAEKEAGDELYQDFRTFDNVRDSLVTRELGAALNDVFASYDPLAVDELGNSTAPSMSKLSDDATEKLKTKAGNRVHIDGVIITYIDLDKDTDDRLGALNTEVANTRIATQKQATATATAAANKALAASVSNDPNVLVSRCLDIYQQLVDSRQGVPQAGINCWPGNQQPGLILPAAK